MVGSNQQKHHLWIWKSNNVYVIATNNQFSHKSHMFSYVGRRPTIFKYCLSAASIYFLPANEETGGVSKVDMSQFCIVVYGSWVHQVFNWLHVLIAGLDIHIQASDDARTPLAVEQEEIVFGLYKTRKDGLF